MTAIWIVRDDAGIVRAAYVARYTDPATLKELRENGRRVELVVAESVTLCAPLPSDIQIVE